MRINKSVVIGHRALLMTNNEEGKDECSRNNRDNAIFDLQAI